MELSVVNGTVETLWVRIEGETNDVDVTAKVNYRPLGQDSDVHELFFEELKNDSKSTAFVFMGDFSLPEINWDHQTVGTTLARRFLKIND